MGTGSGERVRLVQPRAASASLADRARMLDFVPEVTEGFKPKRDMAVLQEVHLREVARVQVQVEV